jgi:hypothetical protein
MSLPIRITHKHDSSNRDSDTAIGIANGLIASELGVCWDLIARGNDGGHMPLGEPARGVQGDGPIAVDAGVVRVLAHTVAVAGHDLANCQESGVLAEAQPTVVEGYGLA